MSSGSIRALALAATAAALAGAPAAAGAEQAPIVHIDLRRHHGYEVKVVGLRRTVGLTISRLDRERHSGSATTYVTRGRVGRHTIEADFGGLGRISMRFSPSGREAVGRPHRHCVGPDHSVTRFGVYRGLLSFRGEDGYVRLAIHQGSGRTRTPPALRCSPGPAAASSGGRGPGHRVVTRLWAGFRLGLRAVRFGAVREPGGGVSFRVVAEQSEGRLATLRTAFARAGSASFASDSKLSYATVRPPAPFSGVGYLTRRPSGARLWSGPLAVSFPGEPGAPLTGPEFKTQLQRSW